MARHDVRAGVAVHRAGGGEPLVLLPGLGVSSRSWAPTVPALARGRHVLAVDLPGFGASAPAGTGWTLDAVADRLADALGALGVPPADVAGHSLGGVVALRLARRHPDRVRGVALLAPPGFAPTPLQRLARPAAVGLLAARPLRAALARLAGGPLRPLAFARLARDPRRLPRGPARGLADDVLRSPRIAAGLRAAAVADARADLVAARVPVAFGWGVHDRLVPLDGLWAALALRPGAPAALWRRSGHLPMLEEPAAVARDVPRLLDEARRRASAPP